MPLTDDDKKEVGELIGAALTEHGKDAETKMNVAVRAVVGKAMKGVTDSIATLTESVGKIGKGKEDDTDDDVADDKKGKGKADPEITKQLERLAKDNKALADQVKAEKDARDAEKAARLKGERETIAAGVLRKAGVSDFHIKAVLALHASQLATGEDGKHFFKDGDNELPIDKAYEAFLKSEDGKAVLPARDARGTGAGRGTTTPPNGKQDGPVTEKQAGEALLAIFGRPGAE